MQNNAAYLEKIPFQKGAQGLDIDIWISLVSRRKTYLSDATIYKVEHHRSVKNDQGFLAIYVNHPIRPTIFVIERAVSAPPRSIIELCCSSSSSMWGSSRAQFTISIPTPDAKEALSSIIRTHKDVKVASTLIFPPDHLPSDLQLAVLLHVMKDFPSLSDSYIRCVFDVLKELFTGREQVGKNKGFPTGGVEGSGQSLTISLATVMQRFQDVWTAFHQKRISH
ncbi:hypothetical protein HETIRDRAFT_380697 [Heterobasidion irregulare TC 32-1]|uniref:Uncharacterized protein n=1 Tax=Heterobasidion irregulare (strain TC 32-1) TaxID=747525 RepID=W4KKZ9_HETIT|nr:uncharacterized protein HETIRDRAFT_380697 [Heterobasidion irregulare TC 32-1]ETW86364.1 hypothetical protein HETIRDRAFT_380697 [Heterobasidion irregulare TC 32-1]